MLTPSSWKQKSPNFKFFFFPKNYFAYLWLQRVLVAAGAFSSCSQQGLLFTAVLGLHTVVVPLVAEHGAGVQASVVVAHGLRCSTARGIPPPRVQIHTLWTGRRILKSLDHQESPPNFTFSWCNIHLPFHLLCF